jgi:parallel beta-helix repeat protein
MTISRKSIGIISIVAIVALVAFVALSATASAAVINVPSAGNETIQQAINNASDGDTILVNAAAYAGTTETVDVTQSNIIIRSVNGRAVVSAGGASDHVFNITDQTNVTLEGFTIRDAHGTTQDVAGIYMHNASKCTISNIIVTNISATVPYSALGIYLYGSSNNNTFSASTSVSNVTATSVVCGIRLWSSNNNTFSASTSVSDINSGHSAYGILLQYSSNNNTFSSNTSVYNVTATASGTADADAEAYGIGRFKSNNNTFSSNTSVYNVTATASAGYGTAYADAYGIYLQSSSSNAFSSNISVYNVTATGDDAYADAYGILLSSSSNNNRFTDFTITEIISGGGTTSYGVCISESSNNVFSGGNIYSMGEPRIDYAVWLDNCTHNTINESAIRYNGHGFWLNQSDNNTIERNLIVNNTALPVSGVFLSIGSNNNEVHENCFYYNGYELLQAVDHGSQNNFDRNYWEPPPGLTLGDPYRISGDAMNRDHYPLTYCPLCAVEAPIFTPTGLVALVSLLSTLAVLTMRRKRR